MEKLFFELASESRLCILRELQKENVKMQEIARRLDVTATEAFRQLQRLSEALLVQKQPDSTFTVTQYGKLVLQLSSPLEFALKHKEYFLAHDVWQLPSQFVGRIGELSQANLILDTVESLNRGQRMFMKAQQYGWGIAEGVVPELMGPIIDEHARKGLKFRFLIPEDRLPSKANQPSTTQNIEIRGLADLPAIIAVTEKEAAVCFRLVEGRMDYSGFYGKDSSFLRWAKDLFLYYWDKGKRA